MKRLKKKTSDFSNLLFRAGFLKGLALNLEDDYDKKMLLNSSRSLVAYANMLRKMEK